MNWETNSNAQKNKTLTINYLKTNHMATNTLNLGLVEEMITDYKTKQYESIVTNTVNPMAFDARSVWFKLEALKLFIKNLEDEVAKHPEFGLHDFGVRFYYSAYPKNEVWNDPGYEDIANINSEYQKLHTLIGIPTTRINGVDSDFDPYDIKTYTGNKPTDTALAIMAENHGELNPPGSPLGLWF
jgi:hypothetical protein